MNPIRISTFLGENNRLPAQKLRTKNGVFMRHIVNADVTDAGTLQRRQGVEKVVPGDDCHSFWSNGKVGYFIDKDTLYMVDEQLGKRVVLTGLRQQLADYRQRARCNPTPAGGGAPAEDPLFLLSDLLSRADERAGELAEFADRAHIAGRACEAAYDSLRVKSSGHVEASSPP